MFSNKIIPMLIFVTSWVYQTLLINIQHTNYQFSKPISYLSWFIIIAPFLHIVLDSVSFAYLLRVLKFSRTPLVQLFKAHLLIPSAFSMSCWFLFLIYLWLTLALLIASGPYPWKNICVYEMNIYISSFSLYELIKGGHFFFLSDSETWLDGLLSGDLLENFN